MNIQGANLLSAMSGSDGLGNLQQGQLGLTADGAGFASALMEQLGILQGSLDAKGVSSDLTTLQSWMTENGGDLQQGLQKFAASYGQDLPLASRGSQDIDLEDTLQTLSEVLQQLQQLDTDSENSLISSISDSTQIEPEVVDVVPADAEQAAEAAKGMLNPAPMPVALPQADLPLANEESDLTGLLSDVKKPSLLQTQDVRGQGEAVNAKTDDSGLEFDRSISAMMAKDEAGARQQDKPATAFKAENLVGKLADATVSTDNSKSGQDIAGDISRMNTVVRNENIGSAPTNQPALIKHFSDPGWRQELGDKLIWMHKQSIPSVELRLNPEHLGPVLVKIDVSQEQATVAFTAQNQAVKEAIEAAIPKLREMLGGQQLNLVDVNVSQQQSDQKLPARDFFQTASEQGQRRQSELDSESKGAVNEAQNIVDEIEAGRAIASQGLLSLFA